MILNINGNECELNFGIGFIRELDERYFVANNSGIKFGNGLEIKVPMLLTGDVLTLSEFIYMGTARMTGGRPSPVDVDDFIDSVADIEKLFDEVIELLKKSNACKVKAKRMEESLKKEEEILRDPPKNKR